MNEQLHTDSERSNTNSAFKHLDRSPLQDTLSDQDILMDAQDMNPSNQRKSQRVSSLHHSKKLPLNFFDQKEVMMEGAGLELDHDEKDEKLNEDMSKARETFKNIIGKMDLLEPKDLGLQLGQVRSSINRHTTIGLRNSVAQQQVRMTRFQSEKSPTNKNQEQKDKPISISTLGTSIMIAKHFKNTVQELMKKKQTETPE